MQNPIWTGFGQLEVWHTILTSASLMFLQVSVAGVTGARSQVASRVEGLLTDLRTATDKPIAVGFGISTGEHAAQVTV